MSLDRFDRKMLLRFLEEGPRFLSGGPESRAFDLFQKGLLDREWMVRSATMLHQDYAWRYRLSAKGRGAIGWPPKASPPDQAHAGPAPGCNGWEGAFIRCARGTRGCDQHPTTQDQGGNRG